MKKMKIVATLIAIMVVGLSATSISGAVELNADVNVRITSFVGLVSPVINQTAEEQINQSIEFLVNVTEPVGDPENNSYIVDDELIINLDINDESGREAFILPRYVFYRVVLARDISAALNMPSSISLLSRLLPVRVPLSYVQVVDTLSSAKSTNISIPLDYVITNETMNNGENLTMYITVMGFLPGNTNGLLEGKLPIIDHKIVNLEVSYVDNEA